MILQFHTRGYFYGSTFWINRVSSDWRRNFLNDIATFNLHNLKISTGVRVELLIIALLAIGLGSHDIRESVIAILGTLNVSLLRTFLQSSQEKAKLLQYARVVCLA